MSKPTSAAASDEPPSWDAEVKDTVGVGGKSNDQFKYQNKDTTKGAMHRPSTKFHHRITPAGTGQYPAEGNKRYHLYVGEACPWAHRTYIMWKLKGLEKHVGLTLTGWKLENISFMPPFDDYHGWDFLSGGDKPSELYHDPLGFSHIEEIYELASPGYRTEWTDQGQRPYYAVPVFFDTHTKTIVSTESAEIIEILNSDFDAFSSAPKVDLNPPELHKAQDEINAIVYPFINDGVYRCGFASSQQAYENAYHAHWGGMDKIEAHLGEAGNRFLTGGTVTLSDIRLFTTLVRYDCVYFSHFKTNRQKVSSMPNLYRFMRDMYRIKGVKETVNIEFITKHYYWSQRMVNPTGIWPLGDNNGDVEYWENTVGLEGLDAITL